MNWAVKLSIARLSITERVVTVAERARCSGGLYTPKGPPERAAAELKPDQRRRCAVVIDRDPDVVSGLSALLMPELDVQSAIHPSSAALLLDRLEHVDLAFVELELPDFAGEQLLQQLARWPDAIRVLLAQQPLNVEARERSARGSAARPPAVRGPSALSASALSASTLSASAFSASALPRNAYLAHLVLSKPISAQVVRALQRATLGLLRI